MSKMTTYTGNRSYAYLEPGRDYRAFDLAAEVGRVPDYEQPLSPDQRERVARLLRDSIVVSLHDHPCVYPQRIEEVREYNRLGRQVTGFRGLASSGMTAVFDNLMDGACCITAPGGWKWNDILHDLGMRLCDLAHQDAVVVARSVGDIRAAHDAGRLAIVMGLEASTPIENELDRIDILYGFGVRQMGIAYSEANALGSGLKERGDGGLSAFGVQAVERMNKLGMAIDVSHSGDQTSRDVIAASNRPVLITHAGSRTVWDSPRMKPDDVIVACAEKGGLIGLEAAPHTTISRDHRRHSLDSVMDHFVHCVDLVGVDHVAFGPDTLFGDHVGLHRVFAANLSVADLRGHEEFEEVEYVDGLENPGETFPNIAGWLVRHGYSDDDIRKVIGGNATGVLECIW